MRTEMDDEKLAALRDDIVRNGLINPLSVKLKGERYEIVAGHRRFTALQMLGRESAEVRDFTADNVSHEAIKVSENFYKEDVNPADTAQYLAELVERDNLDIPQLIVMTGLSEPTINNYLDLYKGDPSVFAALRAGAIKIGHAKVLNGVKDATMRNYYLHYTVESTPPVNQLNNWIRQTAIDKMPMPEPAAPGADGDLASPVTIVEECCEICRSAQLAHLMRYAKVHKHCLEMVMDAIRKSEG